MAIDVRCAKCDARFRGKDELAGKQVRCPKCQSTITVASPAPAASATKAAPATAVRAPAATPIAQPQPAFIGVSDLLDEWDQSHGVTPRPQGTGAPGSCPTCAAVLSPEALVCVHCGFNRRTGKQLVMKRDVAQRSPEPEGGPRRGWRAKRGGNFGDAIPRGPVRVALLIGGSLLVLGLFAFVPLEMFLLCWFGGVGLSIVGNLWILARAAEESAIQVLLILFVPLYSLLYIVTRWDACKGPVAMIFGGMGVMFFGMLLSLLSIAVFHANEPAPQWLQNLAPPPNRSMP